MPPVCRLSLLKPWKKGQKLLFSHGKIGTSQEMRTELRALTVSECIWQGYSHRFFTHRSFQISARWPPRLLLIFCSVRTKEESLVINKTWLYRGGQGLWSAASLILLLQWFKSFCKCVPLFKLDQIHIPLVAAFEDLNLVKPLLHITLQHCTSAISYLKE